MFDLSPNKKELRCNFLIEKQFLAHFSIIRTKEFTVKDEVCVYPL